jgi:amidophosphoribosyltransferase
MPAYEIGSGLVGSVMCIRDCVSLDGIVDASGVPGGQLCSACFDGHYPIDLPEPELLGKHLLEVSAASRLDADGLVQIVGGAGAADALARP